MTKEERLLAPRYKLIADYPDSPYDIGEIIENLGPLRCKHLANYPHLFKKLEWWEERKVEEMPQYFKIKSIEVDGKSEISFIGNCGDDAYWDFYNNECMGVKYKSGGGTLIHWTIPATEQEYLSYIEGLKK